MPAGLVVQLHDGTQQRLVSIAMSLGLVESKLAPDQVETAAYYFASEALSNAVKPSHGNEIGVDASCHDHTLIMDIADDGIGGATVGGVGP